MLQILDLAGLQETLRQETLRQETLLQETLLQETLLLDLAGPQVMDLVGFLQMDLGPWVPDLVGLVGLAELVG